MASTTIGEQIDIGTNQLSSAKVMIEQNGVTFKAPIRPNPPTQINVQTQDQLEASILGVNLEIPDDTNVTVVFDGPITLTKPFKLGNNSGLELRTSTVGPVVTYVGAGAMIQNINPGVDESEFVFLQNLSLTGDGTNSLIDIKITAFGFSVFTSVFINNFGSIGKMDTPVLVTNRFTGFSINQGLVIINGGAIIIDNSIFTNFGTTNTTWFSFIARPTASFIRVRDIDTSNFASGDSLFFIDPNSPAGSLYTLDTSSIQGGEFYQQGSDIAVNSVADNGSGDARFTTAASHGLVVGKVVVLSAFAGQATYNGTFIVTAVDTPLTGTTFDVEEISFVATDTGNINASSLDNTDPLVLARGNLASPDSRFTGDTGLEVFGAEITSSSLAQDAFEVVTSASWLSNNLERFSEGVVNTGQLICNDVKSRPYNISYSGTIQKAGGGALNIGIIILKNGTNVAFNAPHTVLTSQVQISGNDIVELTDTDTLDIAVINYDSTATAIDISQLSLVVSKG